MSTTAGLVGRATELATIQAALDAAAVGRGALVLVTGEPGIGKTTLLSETARVAADRGARVLRGRCWDDDGSPPYWPWAHVLDGDFPVQAADRFTVFDTVARRLAALGREQPLVVVLDDLQWADPASLALLAFCVGQLRDEPVLFLGAYRDLDGPPLLTSLAAAGSTLWLSGLDPSETGRLVTLLGGEQQGVDIDRIWRRTGGNPFFVTELTRLRMAREFAGPLPAGVRDTVERRLARLSQPCVEMLAAAAVVGPVVPQWILVAVEPDVEYPVLVREAIDAHVLVADVEPLTFAHDLFREVLTAALPVAERARLHRTVAAALKSGRAPASEIAAHWCAAAEAGDLDAVRHAVRYSVRAAAEASDRLADDDACAHYERALRMHQLVVPAQPDLPRVDLVLGWAAAQHRAGQGAEARANYRSAAEKTRDDPERFAAAALGLHRLGAPRGRAHDEVVSLLSQAVQTLDGQRTRLRVQVLAALAGEEFHSWREPHLHRAAVLADEAAALAHELDDPMVLASALHAQHDARWLPGSAPARQEIAEEMLALAVANGEREAEGTARLLRATALIELGDPRGRSELAAYCTLSAELGHSRDRWGAMTRSATAALIAGDVEDAARLNADGVRYGLRIGEPDAHSVRACQAWDLDRFRGRAIDNLPGSGGPPEVARWPPWRAIALAESGDTVAARVAMAGVDVEQSWSPGVPIGPDPWGIAVMAEAVALAGTTDDQRRMLDALAPLAGTHIVAGGLATYAGPADFYRGLLAAALDEPGHATAHFRAALAAAERLGATRWTRLCTERLATLDTSSTGQGAFRKDGAVWTLTWAGTTVRLADAKGLADIATLLAHRGTAVPAITLATGLPPTTGADPLLDKTALAAYRNRLRQLDVDLADAEGDNNLHRAERLHDERDALLHELGQAVGPGGRPRRLGSESERARKAVTGRIRDSIARIAQLHPALAAHLDSAISTGTACRYEPGTPVHWTL